MAIGIIIAFGVLMPTDRPAEPVSPTVPVAVTPGTPDLGYTPNRRISGQITFDDYPLAALRADAEGEVVMELQVTREGTVSMCKVLASSGNDALDETTCRLIKERYRYSPASRDGRLLLSGATERVRWRLPID